MYCSSCGKELDNDYNKCSDCWSKNENNKPLGCLLSGLCVTFPTLGLALYFIWKESFPKKSSRTGIYAIIGLIIHSAFYILYIILSTIN